MSPQPASRAPPPKNSGSSLIEQLEKNYSNVKVSFKNLEDLDTLVNLAGVPTASARFVLSISFDPKPTDPTSANEPDQGNRAN